MNTPSYCPRPARVAESRRWLGIIEPLEHRIAPATFQWSSAVSGTWELAANWSVTSGSDADGVPDADDDVTINPAATVTVTIATGQAALTLSAPGDDTLQFLSGSLTLGGASSINHLDLSAGTLTANAQLELTGTTTFAGSARMSGVIHNTGTITITTGDPNLNTVTLTNDGTIVNQNARLDFEGGGKLVNNAGALFEITATGGGGSYMGAVGGPGFDNAGTFRLSGNAGVGLGGVTFNNLGGQIDVTAGTLSLTSSGTWTNGNLTVASGATLDLSVGTKTLTGTITGSGAGAVTFNSGTLAAGAGGETFDFPSGFFQWGGSGTLSGADGFTNAGFITLTSGDPNLNTTTLTNAGTIINQGVRLDFEGGGKLVNNAGALFEITATGGSGSYMGAVGGPGFDNAGTFRLSGNAGVGLGGVTFNNLGGQIDVTAGTLSLTSSGTWTNGNLTVASGATLDLSVGTKTLTGTITGSGAGAVTFNSGTLAAGAGGETFDFPSGFFQWGGSGTLSGSDGFTNSGFITLTSGDPNLNTTTLTNAGTIINQGVRLDFEGGGKLVNNAGALFEITATGGSGPYMGAVGGPGFDNAGTFRLSGSAAVNLGGVTFNNYAGTVEATAGTLQFSSPGTWQDTPFNVSDTATVDLSGNTKTWSGTFTATGDGVVQFTSGTLSASSLVTLDFPAATFQWGGSGTLTGAGGFDNTGVITIVSGDPNLNNTTLTNHGTISEQSARLDFEGGGKLVNAAGALYVISGGSGGGYMGALGGPGFDNAGTFRLSASVSASLGGLTFNNLGGRIDVIAGTLSLSSSGTWESGNLTLANGAALDLSVGTKTLTGTLTGGGNGTVVFNSGAITAGAGGATFDFPASLFRWGGSGVLNGAEGFTNSGFITLSTGDPNLNTTTLTNTGTIVNEGVRLDFEGGGKLVNNAGALFEITATGGSGAYMGAFGGPGFDNAGTFRLSGNQNVNLGSVTFNNLGGTIDVTAGTLSISSSGAWQGATITVSSSATLDLSAGTKTLTGTLTGSGAGVVTFNSGTLAAGTGGATFNFPSGFFRWGGSGTLSGSEGFTNAGFITLTSGDPNLNTTTLTNTGTIVNQNVRLDFEGGGKLVNAASGVFEIAATGGGGSYAGAFGGPGIENAGTLRLSGNHTVSLGGVPLSNTGTVEVAAGTLSVTNVAQFSAGTLSAGTWRALAGTTLNLPGNVVTNAGTIEAYGSIPQIGSLATNSGTLLLGPGTTLNLPGSLSNTGTLRVGGTLNVAGNFTQSAGATLGANVGSAPAGSAVGSVVITGTAALDGTLDIAIVGGFGPVTGQTFPVMNYASHTGNFSSITGLTIGGITFFDALVGATSVKLTAVRDASDLRPENIAFSADAFVGLPVTISFTIRNLADIGTLTAAWSDAVYISDDQFLDNGDTLVGRVAHTGVLGPGGSYDASLTAPLPVVTSGAHYVLIVADDLGQSPDSNRLNNTVASTGTITTDLEHLVHGITETATIASGQDLYYQFDVPAGRDVLLTATYAALGEAKIYARLNAIPTSATFDLSAISLTDLAQKLAFLSTAEEPYYILIEGQDAAGSGKSISLSTRDLGFEIVSTAPTLLQNAGTQQITVTGSHFTATTSVRLVDAAGTPLVPTTALLQNANTIVASFDLSGVTPGLYDIRLDDSGAVATANDALRIDPAVTQHSGTIAANETWFSGIVHRITGALTVNPGVTLTIQPGAIVKFDSIFDFTVNGTLSALGTLAQPIVFTSLRDDAHGGDTNSDGSTTSPLAGDWGRILVGGAANFDHAELLYGSGTKSGSWEGTGAIRTTGGSVDFSNSAIKDAFFDGILAWGGAVTIENSLFARIDRAVSAHPGSPVTVTNSTFADNRIGLLTHGGTLSVANSVVASSLESGIQFDFGSFTGAQFTDVYSTVAGSVNYRNTPNLTGTSGNISADPKFKSAATDNYRLNFGSPAIDAANGALAPTNDATGLARYDDPRTTNTGSGSPAFADMGAFEFVENAPSRLDLVVTSVLGEPIVTGGTTAHVTWTVRNAGSDVVRGAWHDTIQLVSNNGTVVLDAGRVLTSTTLGPGQSGTFAADVTVPFGTEGQYRWQVKTNADGAIFEGTNSGNNVGTATERSALEIPTITVGTPTGNAFQTVDGGFMFKVRPTPGSDVRFDVDRTDMGLTEIFLGVGQAPTTTSFFSHTSAIADPNARIEISGALDTDYYVLFVPRTLPTGPANFTINSALATFGLDSIEVTKGSNAGTITIPLDGSSFTATLTAQLIAIGGAVVNAKSVSLESASRAFATFDLTGLVPGAYDVKIASGALNDQLDDAFTVVAGTGGDQVHAKVILPERVRTGRIFTAYLEYTNTGDTNALAPIITLTSPTGNLMRLDADDTLASSLSILGTSPDGAAGILRPGEAVRVPFQIQAVNGTNTIAPSVSFGGGVAFNFEGLRTTLEPSGFAPEFDSIFDAVIKGTRTTDTEYLQLVSDAATLFAQREGATTHDVVETLSFLIEDAFIDRHTKIRGHVFLGDLLHPAGGIPVIATNATNGTEVNAFSTADGLVRFVELPASLYAPGSLPPGYTPPVISAGTYNISFLEVLPPTNLQPLIVPGSGIAEASWVVQPGGEIDGHVTLPAGVTPDPDAGVGVVLAENSAGGVFTAGLDASGAFRLRALPNGTYTVSVLSGGEFASPMPFGDLAVKNGTVLFLDDLLATLGGTITGTVKTSGGAPIAGVAVTANDAASPVAAFTDASGVYVLEHVSAGAHIVTARLTDFVGQSLTVPVSESVTTSGQDFTLAVAGSISGTVTRNSAPVQGVEVEVRNGMGDVIAFDFTDAAGHYKLPALDAATYTFVADGAKFALFTDTIMLAAGESKTENVALDAASSVSGVITQAGTNQPLPSVLIHLLTPGGVTIENFTADDGTWSFTRLPSGHFTVMLPDGSNRHEFDITGPDTNVPVNFSLEFGSITGVVELPDGTPNRTAHVLLIKDGQIMWSSPTADDGSYLFTLVSPGAYDIAIADSSYDYALKSGIAVTNAQVTNVPDALPGTASLKITVTDAVLNEPPGVDGFASITQLGVPSDLATIVPVPPSGVVTLPNLPPGDYLLEVGIPGLAEVKRIITIGAGANTLNVSAAAGATVSGDVTDGAVAVEGLTIVLYDPAEPRVQFTAITDAAGHYTLPNLPAGTFTVVISDHRAGNAATLATKTFTSVAVGVGANVTQDAALAASTITVTGHIADGTSHVPTSGVAYAISADGIRVAESPIDVNGNFAFTTLAPGNYSITAEANGFVIKSQTLTVADGQTVTNVEVKAKWFVDPPANGIIDDPNGIIGSAFDFLFNGVKAGVKLVLQPPDPLSDLPDPLFNLLPPNCPCPEAHYFYGLAGKDDAAAKAKFQDLLQLYDDYVIGSNLANGGLFAVQLVQYLESLYLTFYAGPLKAANALASMQNASQTLSKLPQLVTDPKTIPALQAALNGIIKETNVILNLAPAAGILTDGANSIAGLASGSQTGDFGVSVGAVVDSVKAFATSPSVGTFGDILGKASSLGSQMLTLVNLINTFRTQALTSVPGAAGLLDVFGAILGAAQLFATATDSILQLQASLENFAQNEDVYAQLIQKRNTDYQRHVQAIAKCIAACKQDPPPDPPQPPPPPNHHDDPPGNTNGSGSIDPNDKLTIGFGANGYIKPGTALPFTILFENKPEATAPAQVVTVTDKLSANLDWSSVRLGDMGFNGVTISVPAGLTHFETDVNVASDPNPVHVVGDFNATTGVLSWTLTSVDPITGDLPEDPLAGFLPPNNASHDGEGFVTYTVNPLTSLADGATITNMATIVFDVNAPIDTPVTTNTIDSVAPTSSITVLPASTAGASFQLDWTGDDGSGSGVGSYDIFVSDNGGAFTPFLLGTMATNAMFTGKLGHTYRFYSVAVDNVGNAEAAPLTADATTKLGTSVSPTGQTFTDADGDTFTITLKGAGSAQVITSANGIALLELTSTTATSALTIAVKKAAAGDGRIALSGVTGNAPLGSFTAPFADLTDAGFQLTGLVGKLTLGNVLNGADLMLGGAATEKTTLTLGAVGNGTDIVSGAALVALTASSLGDGSVRAPSIGALNAKAGGVAADLIVSGAVGKVTLLGGGASGDWSAASFGAISVTGGDFAANLTSTASAASLGKTAALASLKITGGDLTGNLTTLGKVGAITVAANKLGQGGHVSSASLNFAAAALASLSARDITGTTIVAGSLGKLTASAGALGADLTLTGAAGAISVAGGSATGDWTAATFGKVSVKSGDFAASLTSTAPAGGKPLALASLTVTGGNLTGEVTTLGGAGKISAAADKTGQGGQVLGAMLDFGASNVSALSARSITDGTLEAGSLGKLSSTGGALDLDVMLTGALGSVRTAGGTVSGEWTASSFGSITAKGGRFDANLTATASAAALGKKTAVGKIAVIGGDLTGDVTALGNLAGISVARDKAGLGGSVVGSIIDLGGTLASVTALSILDCAFDAGAIGKLQTSAGSLRADLSLTGAAGAITVGLGDAEGDWIAATFGAVKVTGGDFAANLTATAPAGGTKPVVASLQVAGGDLTGNLTALAGIGPVSALADKLGNGGDLNGATFTIGSLAGLTVAGDAKNSLILSGANLGRGRLVGGAGISADTFAGGSIGKVSIGGDAVALIVGAGLDPTDAAFHDLNDTIVGGTASAIAGIIVTGSADSASYFAAGAFGSVKVGGATIDPAADARFKLG